MTTRDWRPTVADLGDSLVALVATAAGLGVAVALVPDVGATGPLPVVGSAVLVAVGDWVLRGPLRVVAARAGAVGALFAGLAVQLAIVWLALAVVPGITVASGWGAFWVLVVTGIVMAVARWLWGANDSGYVVADVLRRARSRARRAGVDQHREREAGLLVVQLDGVAAPVLAEAIEAGLAPTVQRWLDTGTHRLDEWWARVPSTTPASTAGLLHGDSAQIPAFRWWDRGLGRLVVTNHPADAALVERRLTNGAGLLAGGGTAVSTMFTGDAARALLVMSRTRAKGPDGQPAGLGPGPEFLRFFASPFVLARAVSLTIGEMLKELYQARRQAVRAVEPRVSRGGWYVVLRAVTNVLMRDLSTSLVAEGLVRGDPVVYVDLVDYDEIAHHAGPTRPESLRSLEGLDRVLGLLEQVRAVAPRDYQVVVVSDHGQALGPTFEQVAGEPLLAVVRRLMAAAAPERPVGHGVQADGGEDWGPVNTLLTTAAASTGVGPDADRAERSARSEAPEVVVVGSGNLALVWFPRAERRLTAREIDERWPGLVAGLATQRGVGLVVVDDDEHGLVAIGPAGRTLLERPDAAPQGEDPLLAYGPRARADLARAGRLEHTGDLLLVSSVTERGHVHAFEGQVGSHGGIGGAQNRAVLLHPVAWALDDDLREDVGGRRLLVGAEAVHAQLLRWLVAAGVRT